MGMPGGLAKVNRYQVPAVLRDMVTPPARPRGRTAIRPVQLTVVKTKPDVGRNDPCPCASGKKFKKCCLEAA